MFRPTPPPEPPGRGPLSLALSYTSAGRWPFCPVPHSPGPRPDIASHRGPQPVRKGLKNYIGSEKVPERCPRLAPFEGLRVSPRGLKIVIVGRFAHFCFHELRLSAVWADGSACLS